MTKSGYFSSASVMVGRARSLAACAPVGQAALLREVEAAQEADQRHTRAMIRAVMRNKKRCDKRRRFKKVSTKSMRTIRRFKLK
jgi:hypothetical protein